MPEQKSGFASPFDIAKKIAAIDYSDDIDVFGPKIIAVMKDEHWLNFITLNEKPHLFDGMRGADGKERHFMLRQVYDHRFYGRTMSAGLVK